MADRPRPRRSPARYLAPLALAVAVLGIYLVSQHALGGGSSHAARHRTSTSATATAHGRSHHAPAARRAGPRFYVVRSGDNLSVISSRTGVPLATLQTLNPRVSSTSLQVGQRLELRR